MKTEPQSAPDPRAAEAAKAPLVFPDRFVRNALWKEHVEQFLRGLDRARVAFVEAVNEQFAQEAKARGEIRLELGREVRELGKRVDREGAERLEADALLMLEVLAATSWNPVTRFRARRKLRAWAARYCE